MLAFAANPPSARPFVCGLAEDAASEETIAYVLAVKPGVDRLDDAMRQLTGVLILAVTGSLDWRDHPLLSCARRSLADVRDAIGPVHPPAACLHHHRHLLACESRLAESLGLAAASRTADDAKLQRALAEAGRASHELQAATRTLPGFETPGIGAGCGCVGA